VRIVNAPEVLSPAAPDRPAPLPMRRRGDIVVSRAPARDPRGVRGQIVDILV